MKNIELKVKIDDFKEIKSLLKKMEARHVGEMYQKDTYFNCKNGRLKIRNINNKRFELILYKRPDKINEKISDYEIFPIKPEEIDSVQSSMNKRFGERIIIEKIRDLWIFRNTRIHLDEVASLGSFLELETVVENRDFKKMKTEFNKVFDLLDLEYFKKYSNSYSDLLSEKSKTNFKKFVKFDQSILVELFTHASKPA